MNEIDIKKIEPFEEKTFPFRISIQKNRKQLVITHWHEHLELIKVLVGRISVTINEKTYTAVQNDIIFINSCLIHSVTSVSDDDAAIMGVVFDKFFLTNIIESFETKHIYSLFLNSNTTNVRFEPCHKLWEDLNQCIDSSYNELLVQEIGYEISIKSYIYRLTTLLLRYYKDEIFGKHDLLKIKTELLHLKPIFEYIEQNYSQKIYIKNLSSKMNLSLFYFTRYFKKITGKAPLEYVTQVRLNAAIKLLLNSNISITEISEKTGFCNVNYFDKIFKKSTGTSPLEFRNSMIKQ